MNPNDQDSQQPAPTTPDNTFSSPSSPEQAPAQPEQPTVPANEPSYNQAPIQPEPQPVAPTYPLPQQQQVQYTQQPFEQNQSQPQPPMGPSSEDPGKVFGIIGIILAFIPFLALFGLILSIISFVKSSKANHSKTLGIVGIVLNSVIMVVGILIFVFFVLLTGSAYNGIQQRAKATEATSAALQVVKVAEADYAMTEKYPANAGEIMASENYTRSDGYTVIDGKPSARETVGYKKCSETGAQVYYLSVDNQVMIKAAGDASETDAC
jgi:hypothetical protein